VLCQFNGETIENSKGKAEALNEQFKSVFTKEDLDNFPQIDDSGTPDIPNLNISTEGHYMFKHDMFHDLARY
jgi:hypothetical protein